MFGAGVPKLQVRLKAAFLLLLEVKFVCRLQNLSLLARPWLTEVMLGFSHPLCYLSNDSPMKGDGCMAIVQTLLPAVCNFANRKAKLRLLGREAN